MNPKQYLTKHIMYINKFKNGSGNNNYIIFHTLNVNELDTMNKNYTLITINVLLSRDKRVPGDQAVCPNLSWQCLSVSQDRIPLFQNNIEQHYSFLLNNLSI